MNSREIIMLAEKLKRAYRMVRKAATVHSYLTRKHAKCAIAFIAESAITHQCDETNNQRIDEMYRENMAAVREFWLLHDIVVELHEQLLDAMNSGISHSEFLRIVRWIEEAQ